MWKITSLISRNERNGVPAVTGSDLVAYCPNVKQNRSCYCFLWDREVFSFFPRSWSTQALCWHHPLVNNLLVTPLLLCESVWWVGLMEVIEMVLCGPFMCLTLKPSDDDSRVLFIECTARADGLPGTINWYRSHCKGTELQQCLTVFQIFNKTVTECSP